MFKLKKLKEPHLGRKRYKVWLRQAEHDLQAAEHSYEEGFNEWTTYQAEQAVEKSLKAIIVHAGYVPPKVHKLSILMSLCNGVNNEFKNTRFEYRLVDSFTFISRYPFLLPGRDMTPHDQIDDASARGVLDQAKKFVDNIGSILEGRLLSEEQGNYIPVKATAGDTESIEARIDYVVGCLLDKYDPEKIVLFGSYARNKMVGNGSTIDLLIIADTEKDFLTRIKEAREQTSGGYPAIEPLVYTPEEYKIMTEEEGEGFLESAVEEGIVLYEKGKPNTKNFKSHKCK